ncbi:MAG: flagellar biosynthesis protein FlgE [Gammaproteobacteria bacterium]|nr:flagellar biosynthesis protein FlgE [Gammaproteobacteria bacterium]
MDINAFSSGINGIHKGMQSFTRNAEKIASATTPTETRDAAGSLEKPLVGMISDEQQVAASAKVVKAADEMLGTLFDDMA